MSDYSKLNIRFSNFGLNLTHDPTTLPFGKFTEFTNLTSAFEGEIRTREGITKGNVTAISGNPTVVGFRRLNNSVAGGASYIVRAGTALYITSNATVPFTIGSSVATGFSSTYGSIVTYRPSISATIWSYIGDSTKMVKTDGTNVHPIGYAQPTGIHTAGSTDFAVVVVASSGNLTQDADYSYRFTLYSSSTGAESLYQSSTDPTISTTSGHTQATVTFPSLLMTNYTGVDKIRIYRKGGTVDTWRLLTTQSYTGTTNTYTDNTSDDTIGSADLLDENSDKPFTTTNTVGVDVAGTALPYLSDPYLGYILAVGDPLNPGYVYWTNKFDPDRQDPDNRVEVTSPQDPLQNILIYNGRPYVFSKEALYELFVGLSDGTFTPSKTSSGHGLFTPHAFAVGPEIYFLSKDGIYATNGGVERCLTDDEMRSIFKSTETVGGIPPISWTNTSKIRMAYYNNELWFQYQGAFDSSTYIIVYDVRYRRWRQVSLGSFGTGDITSIYSDEENVAKLLFGTAGGFLMYQGGITDNTIGIGTLLTTGNMTLGAPLIFKEFGQLVLDVDPTSVAVNVLVTMNTNSLTPTYKTATSSSATRTKLYVDLGSTFADDIKINIGWAATGPKLYGYELLYKMEEPEVTTWSVNGTNNGIEGWQILRSAYITFVANGTVTLTVDNLKDDGTIVSTGYTLTGYANKKIKLFIPFIPTKGKLFNYKLSLGTATKFRFFPELSEVHVKPWVTSLGYQTANPFAGGYGISGGQDAQATNPSGSDGSGGGGGGGIGGGPNFSPSGFNFEGGGGLTLNPPGVQSEPVPEGGVTGPNGVTYSDAGAYVDHKDPPIELGS